VITLALTTALLALLATLLTLLAGLLLSAALLLAGLRIVLLLLVAVRVLVRILLAHLQCSLDGLPDSESRSWIGPMLGTLRGPLEAELMPNRGGGTAQKTMDF
jgi:hypothetical protein